jgi:iron complex transport system permease protein
MLGRDGAGREPRREGANPVTDGTGSETGAAVLSGVRLAAWAGGLLAAAAAVAALCSLVGVAELTRQVWLTRVARLTAAAAVGAALAAGGMALQGLLRNPLAEPYILGISSGAGVGVLLGLAAAGGGAMPAWASTPVLAFGGAAGACAVVYAIAQRRGRLDPYSLILSGVIVNSFNGAIMLTIQLYVDRHRIADFAYWAMGRLPDSVDLHLLAVCGACVAAGWLVCLLHAAGYNVLGLGDEVAGASGVSVQRLRVLTFAAVGLMTAAAVALAGPIAFLGLIVPHICRMVLGPDHRLGVVASGFAGAIFLMAAETLCRTVGDWLGLGLIPVGILTALAGGPFFIYLLRTRFRGAPA